MSDFLTINAELREDTGRSASRRLRRTGRIPAIIYGGGKSDLPISLDANTIGKALNVEHFHTSILTVAVAGGKGDEKVLLKDAQYDPLTDVATHLDFFRVQASDTVHLEVPIVAVNYAKCPGVVAGGKIDLVRHELMIACRADAIPEHIEVDCSKLELGTTIHVNDLVLPEGVEAPHEVNFTILNLAAVKGGAVEAEAESED